MKLSNKDIKPNWDERNHILKVITGNDAIIDFTKSNFDDLDIYFKNNFDIYNG